MTKRRFFDKYEEEEIPSKLSKNKKWIIIGLLAIILWAGFRGTRGVTILDNVDSMMVALIVTIIISKGIDAEIKLHSPKIVSDPISTTFNGRIYDLGNWKAVRMGGASWGIYQDPGHEGTIIFPSSAILKRGEHGDIACSLRWMPMENTPASIRKILEDNNFPRPFYIGFADAKILQQVPDLNFLIEEFFNTNQYNFQLEREMRSIMQHIERKENWKQRLTQKTKIFKSEE